MGVPSQEWWVGRGYKRHPAHIGREFATCLYQKKVSDDFFINIYQYPPIGGREQPAYEVEIDIEIQHELTMRVSLFSIPGDKMANTLEYVEVHCLGLWAEFDKRHAQSGSST